jgi:hypothetical protein
MLELRQPKRLAVITNQVLRHPPRELRALRPQTPGGLLWALARSSEATPFEQAADVGQARIGDLPCGRGTAPRIAFAQFQKRGVAIARLHARVYITLDRALKMAPSQLAETFRLDDGPPLGELQVLLDAAHDGITPGVVGRLVVLV